jgi:hypothetical protein
MAQQMKKTDIHNRIASNGIINEGLFANIPDAYFHKYSSTTDCVCMI